MEKAGRAAVRAGLNIPSRGRRRRTELSEDQKAIRASIANAGLAPLEEVRAAFLEKGAANESKIKAWGDQLRAMERQARERAEERWREEHTRYEPCAYPGCGAKIKVVPMHIPGGFPKPVRRIMIWNVAIMQFLEGLSDRQAAEAVRSRLDWKYLLGLEPTDAGFHSSLLCEFRSRLFEVLLKHLKARGWLIERQRQRTDSTHNPRCCSQSQSSRTRRAYAPACSEYGCGTHP
jgi:Transposase domain (DUF772)